MRKRVTFENLGRAEYDVIGFREPKKGEYYLSGAIVVAYVAPNDLTSKYHVVKPRMETLVKFQEE